LTRALKPVQVVFTFCGSWIPTCPVSPKKTPEIIFNIRKNSEIQNLWSEIDDRNQLELCVT
jgi:hypothetical protein